MQFIRIFALVGIVLSAGLAVAAPVSHPNAVAPRCSDGCTSGTKLLGLVTNLQADVKTTLSLLAETKATGANPTDLFVKLATLVDTCTETVAVVEVDTTGVYNGVKAQVSNIAAKIILDISTGCSKFQNVKIEGFAYLDLCTKIDLALKGLCVAMNALISGCLQLISVLCLAKSTLLAIVNFKFCLGLFAGLKLSL
ncbi:hypothetical protein FRC08_008246 [Ceratobasidium sp. 394]|nr:hypothetical protein FRC08_008246 [Ceratobasidium sp. 394]KAG9097698.1 hypothetical protein FS749_005733 [Ceratobasidium sp. UAMH 11750]